MPDYSNCLRPEFTKQVFGEMQQGRSLNLFSRCSGRSRLLEDLYQVAHGAGIKVIKANLKGFQFNYRGLLKDIESQMVLKPGVKLLMQDYTNAPIQDLPGISTLYEYHLGEEKRKMFILFDDFDAIVGSPYHEFPVEFFNELNSLKNIGHTLCCVTLESHSGKNIYYEGGRKHSSSWLELIPLDVPHLKRGEIKAALNALLRENIQWNKEPNKEWLITAIYTQPENKVWYLVELLAEDYRFDLETSYKKRLRRCLNRMKKRYPDRKWWNSWSWEGFKREIKELLGIVKEGKALLNDKNREKE